MTSVAAPEYAWLLPGSLTADQSAGAERLTRSARDWVVDTVIFLAALGYALFSIWDVRRPDSLTVAGGMQPAWLLPVDAVAGLATCASLWLRRRWPLGLAVVTTPIGLVSPSAGIALMFILFTVTVHRRLPAALAIAGAGVATALVELRIHPDPELTYPQVVAFVVVLITLVLVWGMFVRARRQLVISWRERAHRAEAEQQLRVAQARHLERTRIAREMHDVLAHRISLLSLHAGALEFRPDAAPEEIARAAGVIRANAHQALEDLREVIGVLRDDPDPADRPSASATTQDDSGAVSRHGTAVAGPLGGERPQPTLADLPALVDESRAAGVRVDLCTRVPAEAPLSASVARTAYRIVQEGLTNARKHAAGTAVTVRVTGAPGTGLDVEVVNRGPVGRVTTTIPGTGTGLVGLAERVSLTGGRLDHGWTAGGDFRLAGWLPWPERPS